MSRPTKMTRYAPLAIGAVALVVGLALAWLPSLTGGREESPTPSSVDGGALDGAVDGSLPQDATAPGQADERPQPYVPDLTGEDVGELIVESRHSAHGLIVTGGVLVWLTTEAATLYGAPLDGGTPRRLFSSTAPDALGGTLVSGTTNLYWSVERADGEAESIVAMAKREVSAAAPASRSIAKEGSPDHLLARGDDLYWSDQGVIMTLPAAETESRAVVDRGQLIAGLAVADATLAWLEVPYEHALQGGQAVMIMGPDGDQARTVAAPKAKLQRELLLGSGERLVWVEGKQDGPWFLVQASATGGPTRRLAQTGAVTALTTDGSRLYWAELHGEGEQAVTLLRSVAHEGGETTALGRDSGPVPALAVQGGKLFWSCGRGLKRLALD